MVTFSIIIPVYNSEKYLERCLTSIKNQTFCDFECLIIDDGSDDDSLNLIKKICKDDPRFFIFHQENHGVSSARNLGLKHTHGKYTVFVDSDDYAEPDFLEIANCENKNYPLILFTKDLNEGIIDSEELIDKLHTLEMAGSPWGKIFQTEVIKKNDISFPTEIDLYEDLAFLLKYLFCIETVCIKNKKVYNYTIRDVSLCHKVTAERYKKQLLYFINFAKITTDIKKQLVLKEICISQYLWIFKNYDFFSLLSFSEFHKQIKNFYNDMSNTLYNIKLQKRFGKLALSLTALPFFIYVLFMKFKIFINSKKRHGV